MISFDRKDFLVVSTMYGMTTLKSKYYARQQMDNIYRNCRY